MKKPTVLSTGTAFVGVLYPYRKTPDLYVALPGAPVFCAQCKAEFPKEQFIAHVNSHDLRRRKRRVRETP